MHGCFIRTFLDYNLCCLKWTFVLWDQEPLQAILLTSTGKTWLLTWVLHPVPLTRCMQSLIETSLQTFCSGLLWQASIWVDWQRIWSFIVPRNSLSSLSPINSGTDTRNPYFTEHTVNPSQGLAYSIHELTRDLKKKNRKQSERVISWIQKKREDELTIKGKWNHSTSTKRKSLLCQAFLLSHHSFWNILERFWTASLDQRQPLPFDQKCIAL